LIEKGLEGQTFRFLHDQAPASQDIAISAGEPLRLGLLGEYQLHNAATALTIVEALRGRGWKIPQEAVRQGLAEVRWPARFEVLSRHPLFILDGGHNPQCAEALAESLREYLPDRNSDLTDRESDLPGRKADLGKKAVFLMGMLADKDYRAVIDIITPFAAGFVCLTPDSPRALPAEKLAAELHERGFYAKPCGTAAEGIKEALSLAVRLGGRGCGTEDTSEEGALPVVSFGSLYMAGAVRSAFRSFAGL
jgi:dihydrofolate synthase/folylpolyglutamate synthase